jgi:hypothetical protein
MPSTEAVVAGRDFNSMATAIITNPAFEEERRLGFIARVGH